MRARDITIAGSFNTRDLGGYATHDGQRIAWGRAIRSGNLAGVGRTGVATLKRLNVSRVIDLRSSREIQAEPDPFHPEDGIDLVAIPLFDDLNPERLSRRDVLLDLYVQALEAQGRTFVEIVRLIGSSADAALFHCTAGKDRTGLVAALLLSLVGVPHEDVIADYALTADRIRPLLDRAASLGETLDMGVAELAPLLDCNASTMRQTLNWLDDTYNGAKDYLLSHGLDQQDLVRIRAHLGLV